MCKPRDTVQHGRYMVAKALSKLLVLVIAVATICASIGPIASNQMPMSRGSHVAHSWTLFGPDSSSTNSSGSVPLNAIGGGVNPAGGISCGHLLPPLVCVYLWLPQAANGTYLANADVNGTTYTASGPIYLAKSANVSLSVSWLSSGQGFSYWGYTSGLSIASFEASQTTMIASAGTIWLDIYTVDRAALLGFEVGRDAPTGGPFTGQIELPNYVFASGQSAYFTDGQVVQIQATSIIQHYSFSQWASTSGSLGNLTQSTTNLTIQGNGMLSLMNSEDLANWAGIVEAGSAFTSVSTNINLNLGTGGGDFGFWVGIGGGLGNGSMWQGGVLVNFTSSGTTIVAWWEACYPSGGVCTGVAYDRSPNASLDLQSGSTVYMAVTSSHGNNQLTVENVGLDIKWVATGPSFYPNSQTVEWVVERTTPGIGVLTGTKFLEPYVNGNAVTFVQPAIFEILDFSSQSYVSPSYITPSTGWTVFEMNPTLNQQWPA